MLVSGARPGDPKAMLFKSLIETINREYVKGSGDPEISGVAYDSRRVAPGYLFVCIKGDRFDGHEFIADALNNGASAVVSDDGKRAEALMRDALAVNGYRVDVPLLVVSDARAALPALSARFFGYPSRRLKLVGVTGTKGKTTTTHLMEGILRNAGHSVGIIGTLGVRFNDKTIATKNTTPESSDLQEIFSQMVDEGVTSAVMEVSSHALVKGRTDGCEFDVGVFTNLTQDHLDFHHTLDEYFKAKLMLFEKMPLQSGKPFTAAANADDPRTEEIIGVAPGRTITFGIRNDADFKAMNVITGSNGTEFDVRSQDGVFHISLKLGGLFNVYNALAAIASASALGIDVESIVRGLESVSHVPGRFVSIDRGQDFGIIIDYAHTPDSLANILGTARDIAQNRLIVVFGCGGDRDRGKRPIMGSIATEMADKVVVTSDNPRSENPESIIDEIMHGVGAGDDVDRIVDRRSAIFRAINMAEPGDLVVVAGKGHETYQIFKNETIHFDDSEVVEEALRDLDSKRR